MFFFRYPQGVRINYLKNKMIQLLGFFFVKGTIFFKFFKFKEGFKKFK